MLENLDELIDKNLNLLFESKTNSVMRIDFTDLNGKQIRESKRLAEIMDSKGLINLEYSKKYRCDLTEFGFEVCNYGGWLKYLKDKANQEKQTESEIKEREEIELKLAKSNLEANKLNKRIAKQNEKNEKTNRITTWINVVIGIINIGLLVWQILKD